MAVQHKYTSSVQVTENVARVESILILPNRAGANALGEPTIGIVEITYAIGEETAGVFTRTDTKIADIAIEDLPPATESDVLGLESKALAYGQVQGLYVAGTEEAVP